MSQKIVVVDHAGYIPRYHAELVPGLHRAGTDDDQPVSVIITEAGDILAVKSRHVYTPEGLRYAEEWATKLHVNVLDVYVPAALEVR